MTALRTGGSCQRWQQSLFALVVSLPAEILADGLILADTPGFGAAGDDGPSDDQNSEEFLAT